MAEKPPSASSSGTHVAAAVPSRLGVPTDAELAPTDRHNKSIRDQARGWQLQAGEAWFFEMVVSRNAGAQEGAGHALAGQMAATGEQLALAFAAAGEVRLWQARLAERGEDVIAEMSLRAMAEAHALFVIGAGHALANVAVRALALDADLRETLVKAFKTKTQTPTFAPFSEKPIDWASLNSATAKRLEEVAGQLGQAEIVALIEPVAALGRSERWHELIDRRGTDFHRWRPQTHGIQGVAQQSPWRHVPPTADSPGERILGLGRSRYESAKGLGDEVADIATRGMSALNESMGHFMEAWWAASPKLGGPSYQIPGPTPPS